MLYKVVMVVVFVLSLSLTAQRQEVLELKEIENLTDFWEVFDSIDSVIEVDTNAAIKIFEDAYDNSNNKIAKTFLLRQVGHLYKTPKQFEKCLAMCEELIDDGVVVFFNGRNQLYPSFSSTFEDHEKFPAILKKSNELLEKLSEGSKAEYYIQKPANYDKNKKYPLVMLFHGGAGSIHVVKHSWKSPILDDKYIVAFVQGKNFLSSTRRGFGATGVNDVKKIYEKISNDYSIDTSKVILGGQSAGGRLAIDLAINNHIPVQGLILAYSVKPRAFGADEILSAGINGLKVSMICGETDWALEGQKEMSVIFDKLLVKNRIVIYPDLGHGFPDDFPEEIKKSLEFIENK